MKEWPLTKGCVTLVDDVVFEKLLQLGKRWQASARTKTVYAVTDLDLAADAERRLGETTKRKRVYLHRWIMQPPQRLHVDHINGDGLDNRRENLRIVTSSENLRNRRGTKAVYFGVRQIDGGNWVAYGSEPASPGRIHGRQIHLGTWPTAKLAACARDLWVCERCPTAPLNFSDQTPHSAKDVRAARVTQKRNRFAGVRFKAGKWEAWSRQGGHKVYIGRYPTAEAAAEARAAFATDT
jgi:HNH endonuclease